MRISAWCNHCRKTVEALVISTLDEGRHTQVICTCTGRTYFKEEPHQIVERMLTTTYQMLCTKYGRPNVEEEIL
jgi:NADH:ubiquinone oxidoreductase subunit F (NADH-binding)